MGALNLLNSVRITARKAKTDPSPPMPVPAAPSTGPTDFWGQWANAFDHIIANPISDITDGVSVISGLLTGNGKATFNALIRLSGQQQQSYMSALQTWILRLFKEDFDYTRFVQLSLAAGLKYAEDTAHTFTVSQVRTEITNRIRAIAQAERKAAADDKLLHQSIEREAASAYTTGTRGQLGIIGELADLLAVRDPLVRALVSKVTALIIDAAKIDSAPARLLASLLIKHVIAKLGVEKPIGELLARLADGITGHARPAGLHDVILAICGRLEQLEGQWADFMRHGGSEVEQAGDEWKKVTSLATDAALLAFATQAVADPAAWASEVTTVAGPIVDHTLLAAAHLIGEKG